MSSVMVLLVIQNSNFSKNIGRDHGNTKPERPSFLARVKWRLNQSNYMIILEHFVGWTCQIWSLWSQNWHHQGIYIEKWFLKMYHTCVFIRLAIHGHSDHETDITIEIMWKNGSWRCITLVCLLDLPYMVTWITKLTSPLNSCWKMVPKDVSHLCVCQTCHIWSLWSWNWHHHRIHVKKWFLKMYHTCVFAGLAIYGHHDHKTDITIQFVSKNGSQRYITLVCLLDLSLPYMVPTIMKWTNKHYPLKPPLECI